MAAVVSTKRRRLGVVSSGAIRSIVRSELKEDVEHKRYLLQIASSTVSATSPVAFTPCFLPAQGVDYFQRIGDQVKVEYIKVDLFIRIGVAAVPPRQLFRFLLVVDTAYAGTASAVPTTFGTVNSLLEGPAPSSLAQIIQGRTYPNMPRFLVLIDDTIPLDTGNRSIYHYQRVVRKFKGTCHFVGAGATAADAGKNALFYNVMSEATAGAGLVPEYAGSIAVRYQDM